MHESSSTSSFKKWPTAFVLSVIIVVALGILELVILPITMFSLRPWEALAVIDQNALLSGPFYPNYEGEMTVVGDLRPHTPFAIEKHVRWETDDFGYRIAAEKSDTSDIVIVGDSFTVGASLTQDDTLAVLLAEQLSRSVYPFAPSEAGSFFRDSRSTSDKPRIVVFQKIERGIAGLIREADGLGEIAPSEIFKGNVERNWAIVTDRLKKQAMVRSWVSFSERLIFKSKLGQRVKTQVSDSSEMSFYKPDVAEVSRADIYKMVTAIKAIADAFQSAGIRFIFLPVPDKETVYWQRVPLPSRPTYLKRLIPALRQAGVEVIDIDSTFEKAAEKSGELIYHLDDTHWNVKGVRIAAEQIARYLEDSAQRINQEDKVSEVN